MTAPRIPWHQIAGWLSTSDRRLAALTAVLSGLVAALLGAPALSAAAIALLGGMCVLITVIDARHFVIPDRLSLPLLLLGLVVIGPEPRTIALRLTVALALWAGLSLFAVTARWAKGGEAFGQGDVKLIAVSGLWLSPDWIAPFIIAAALSAIGAYVIRVLPSGKAKERRIAFGAFLAPALLTAVLLQLALPA